MTQCKSTKNPFSENKNDLVIQMVANGKYLIFRDGIDNFDRSYSVQWESVNVYGRQDAIQTYQSTGETVNLSWPLKPGTNPAEYNDQLEAILALGKFVRPLYAEGRIKESPLLRIKFRNLIVETLETPTGTPLLIAPTSISVNYGDRARDVINSDGTKLVVPKRIVISLSGAVINTTTKYYSTKPTEKQEADSPTPETVATDTTAPQAAKEETILNNTGGKCNAIQ